MRSLGSTAIVLAAALAAAGMVNYATTCCCGDSVFHELGVGSCGPEARQAHGHGPVHHGEPEHTCYKDGKTDWLPDSGPGGAASPPLIAVPLPATTPPSAAVLACAVPSETGSGPPGAAVPGGPSCCWLL